MASRYDRAEIVLEEDEKQALERLAARAKTEQRLAQRARIVPACAEGDFDIDVAR
jgi:hypothetical protein